MNLDGKVALVTGAARGIGAVIAKYLASLGAKIALVDILETEMKAKVAEISASDGTAECFTCDVTDWDSVQRTVKDIVEKFGGLDILINNAGITRDNLVLRLTPTDWDIVLNVNLKGAFLLTKAAVRPMMKKKYGKIVNISSVIGLFGNPAQANYASSKAGLIGLTKSVAKEFAAKGIRCNAVAPGYIETEMTTNLPQKAIDQFLLSTPLGYSGKPKDVATVVAFLCSSESDYITGEVIRVDGGMAM